MIKWPCGKCGKSLQAPDHRAGRRGKCPACQHVNAIPTATIVQPVQAPVAPPPGEPPADDDDIPSPELEQQLAEPDDGRAPPPAPVPEPILMDEEEELVAVVSVETVRFDCPKCGIVLKAPKASVGNTTKCPGCKEKVRIPTDEEPVAAFAVDLRTGKSALSREPSAQEASKREASARVSPVVTQARLQEVESIAGAAGADPALHLALTRGYDDVAEILVERGADVNQHGFGGLAPLHYACDKSTLESAEARLRIAKLLLDKGADPNAHDDKGTTPLHRAAEHSRRLVMVLAKKGANLDTAAAATGKTPLHVAAALGLREIVEALVDLGANPGLQDHFGRTPLLEYESYSQQQQKGAMDPRTARLLRAR